MGAEIVKYHNDLNKIKLPNFTEQEQNLLCAIIFKIREQIDKNFIISLYPQDLQNFSNKNLTNKEITDIIKTFETKIFNADFTILLRDEQKKMFGKMRTHFFNHFVVWYNQKEKIDEFDFLSYSWEEFERIDIEINEHFEYLVNSLNSNFTKFELLEFINLSGKYTKTLYRLLKQYRSTGIMKMKWDEFKDIMDIPKEYRQCDLDLRILKPAIKELTKEHTLFDTSRVAFQNLQYEKIKEKGFGGKGQGGKIVGIQFTFTPEAKTTIEQQTTPTQSNHSIQQSSTGNYAITPNNTNGKDEKDVIKEYDTRYRHTKVNYNGETLVIKSVSQGNNGGLSVHFKEFEKGIDKGNIHFNSIDDLIFFIKDNQ
ncbi:replication initiation protein [Helicobacter sp. T3_23-1056]